MLLSVGQEVVESEKISVSVEMVNVDAEVAARSSAVRAAVLLRSVGVRLRIKAGSGLEG